jgi:DNA-binding transcriptional LysR family regulator
LIREYRALNPLVEFSLRNVLTADQGRMLEEGSLDLGFLRMPFAGSPGVDVVPIFKSHLLWSYPHPTLWHENRLYACAKQQTRHTCSTNARAPLDFTI